MAQRLMYKLIFLLLFATSAFAIAPFGTPTSTFFTGSSSTISVPNGGTVVSNDTAVLIFAYNHSGTPGWSTPAGFTLGSSVSPSGGIDNASVFYKNYTAGSTLPSTITITANGGGNAGAVCYAYQGHASAVLDGSAVTVNQTSPAVTSYNAPSITSTQNNDQIVYMWAVNGNIGVGTPTVSTGTKEVEVTRAASGASLYMAMADKPLTTTGASGTNTLTWPSSASTIIGITIAIKAVSPSVPVILNTSPLNNGTVTVPYAVQLTAKGGTGPYTYAVTSGTLPTSLSMNSAGLISGTPTVLGGPTSFAVQVNDSIGGAGASTLTITIYTTSYTPPVLDIYGGIKAVTCANSNTAFSIAVVGKNKVFCDPLGHAFWARGPFGFDPNLVTTPDESGNGYNTYMNTKYPSGISQWVPAEIAVMQNLGWNTLPTYANSSALAPNGATNTVPFVLFALPSAYSLVNKLGWGTGPNHELGYLLSSTWGGFVSTTGTADYYDSTFGGMFDGIAANDQTWTSLVSANAVAKGAVLFVSTDDSDGTHCFGAGPDFATQPSGNNDYRCGYYTLFVAPTDYANSVQQQIYTGGSVAWRKRWTDLLATEYSNSISALNTSWGSSFTTFGTSGYCAGTVPTSIASCGSTGAAESLGTGNGSTLTFGPTTLSHTTVSHFSLGVFVNGTLVGGDIGNGNIWGPNLSGTINYGTGVVNLTFASGFAPAAAASITGAYIANGWGIGTGLQDEDCRSAHASYCGNGSGSTTINLTGVSAGLVTDIGSMTKDIANQYSSTIKTHLATWASAHGFTGTILYAGPTTLGTWTTPPDRFVLQGFNGNVDLWMYGGQGTFTQTELDFVHTYMGDVPLLEGEYRTANAQSAFAWPNSSCNHSGALVTCTVATPNKFVALAGNAHIDTTCGHVDYQVSNVNFTATGTSVTYTAGGIPVEASDTCNVYFDDANVGGFATQALRCSDYQTKVSALITESYTASGIHPFIGSFWWQWYDNWAEQLNWGPETPRGNLYNGTDDVNATGACAYPNGAVNCGGELTLHSPPLGTCSTYIQATSSAIDNSMLSLPSVPGTILSGSPKLSGKVVVK